MSLATAELPIDPDELRAFALACQSELKVAEFSVQYKTLEIEKLKFQIAKLRRMQFGRSSERISRQIEQLELQLEELEAGKAEVVAKSEAEVADPVAPFRERAKPKRKPLPEHLPRQEVVHQPVEDGACSCPDCGKGDTGKGSASASWWKARGGMAKLGEDVTEVLDYVPGHFQVIRHVRPKYACTACDAITQAPAPAMPTPRGRATPATLAHLLVSKYCDHLPLYRQSEIYAREGVDLDRSTLSDWVGQAAWLLDPVVAAIRNHVFAAEKIHGDDTTVPVLAPGLGRTATGRLWVYVRDDRLFGGPAAPAAAYFYSPDRGAAHPTAHMASFTGFLQADGYAGFEGLYNPARTKPGPIIEVACWARLPKVPCAQRVEWQARGIVDANFSMCGKQRNRRLPRKRWIGSLRSMPSRTRPGSRLPPSGLNTGARRYRCSIHSSSGPRRPWPNCRASWNWPRRSAIRLIGVKH
jgi:transposase